MSWTLFFWGDVWKGCLGLRDGIAKIQMEEKLWPSYRNQSSTCTYLEGDRGATLMFWYVIAPCQTAFWELLFSHWCVVYDVNLNPVLAPSHEHPGLYILLIIENFPPVVNKHGKETPQCATSTICTFPNDRVL